MAGADADESDILVADVAAATIIGAAAAVAGAGDGDAAELMGLMLDATVIGLAAIPLTEVDPATEEPLADGLLPSREPSP